MKKFSREIVGRTADNRAELKCGHLGDYAQPTQIGRFQFCASCKLKAAST